VRQLKRTRRMVRGRTYTFAVSVLDPFPLEPEYHGTAAGVRGAGVRALYVCDVVLLAEPHLFSGNTPAEWNDGGEHGTDRVCAEVRGPVTIEIPPVQLADLLSRFIEGADTVKPVHRNGNSVFVFHTLLRIMFVVMIVYRRRTGVKPIKLN